MIKGEKTLLGDCEHPLIYSVCSRGVQGERHSGECR